VGVRNVLFIGMVLCGFIIDIMDNKLTTTGKYNRASTLKEILKNLSYYDRHIISKLLNEEYKNGITAGIDIGKKLTLNK